MEDEFTADVSFGNDYPTGVNGLLLAAQSPLDGLSERQLSGRVRVDSRIFVSSHSN